LRKNYVAENRTSKTWRPLLAALGAPTWPWPPSNDLIRQPFVACRRDPHRDPHRVEERRARLTKLQEDLPEQITELRERFTTDELRKAAEGYLEAATGRYNELVERGEGRLDRAAQQSPRGCLGARQASVDQAVELTPGGAWHRRVADPRGR